MIPIANVTLHHLNVLPEEVCLVFRLTQNICVINITKDFLNMGKQYKKEPNFEILNF